jgi:hypothetical protein
MQDIIEMMTQIMTKMMPYMWYIADVGIFALILGGIAWVVWLFTGEFTGVLRFCGRVLFVLGVFFVACQIAGLLLGMKPWLNLGDISKGEFDALPFWMIGLPFIVTGFVMRIFGAIRPTRSRGFK